jgi:hypothetical protein
LDALEEEVEELTCEDALGRPGQGKRRSATAQDCDLVVLAAEADV